MITEPDLAPERGQTITRFFAAIQAGDYPTLRELLTHDAITRWPQSGERITGALSCVRVYENYPGGPPSFRVQRISGDGQVWVAELVGDYGEERWHLVSVIEFDGARIARMTDYFGPTFPAPAWRQEWVEREDTETTESATRPAADRSSGHADADTAMKYLHGRAGR